MKASPRLPPETRNLVIHRNVGIKNKGQFGSNWRGHESEEPSVKNYPQMQVCFVAPLRTFLRRRRIMKYADQCERRYGGVEISFRLSAAVPNCQAACGAADGSSAVLSLHPIARARGASGKGCVTPKFGLNQNRGPAPGHLRTRCHRANIVSHRFLSEQPGRNLVGTTELALTMIAPSSRSAWETWAGALPWTPQ